MALVAVLVAVGTGCWVLVARPHRVPEPAAMVAGPTAPAGPAGSAGAVASAGGSLASPLVPASSAGTSAPLLVVEVVGKVHRPGVYRLPIGSRVNDAVSAAGGLLSGVDPISVNLARKLADGELLAIGLPLVPGVPGTAQTGSEAGSSGAGGASPAGGGLVDLNSATVSQLDALPGVGPVLAQRIVDWRTQHGRFDHIDQLQSVSGIGDAKYADLKPLVSLG